MRNRYVSLLGAVALLFCAAAVANAGYQQDFETLSGSANGVVLTGQDGYYIPSGTTSTDFYVYTYSGNALGYVQNPDGGNQFAGGRGPGGGTYARAQRDIDFWIIPGVGRFKIDMACQFLLTGVSTNNIGSMSVRSDNTNNINAYIHLATWVDPNNPTSFNFFYLAYDASGTQFAAPGQSPGAGWEGLSLNHWYRVWTVVDYNTNLITECGITDLSTNITNVANPSNWYLAGGSAGSGTLPVAFRIFAGGGSDGNSTAWDNVNQEIMGACCASSGACTYTTESECAGQGGAYQGDFSSCDPNPCQAVPTGACCVGADCTIHTVADCQAMGGNYLGDNTTCSPNPCVVPVKVTTWGSIKSKFH